MVSEDERLLKENVTACAVVGTSVHRSGDVRLRPARRWRAVVTSRATRNQTSTVGRVRSLRASGVGLGHGRLMTEVKRAPTETERRPMNVSQRCEHQQWVKNVSAVSNHAYR